MSAPTLKGSNQPADTGAITIYFTSIVSDMAELVEMTKANLSGIPPAKKRIKVYKKIILKVDILRNQIRVQWNRLYPEVEFPTIPGFDEEFKSVLAEMAKVYEPQLHYVDSGNSDQRETDEEATPLVVDSQGFPATSSGRLPRTATHSTSNVAFANRTAPLVPPPYSSMSGSNVSEESSLVQKPYNDKYVKHVPIFSGDVLSFPLFFELYSEYIGGTDAPDSLKLHLLRTKLTGTALDLVTGFPAAKYERAIEVLKISFLDPTNVRGHIRYVIARVPRLNDRMDIATFQSIITTLRLVESLVTSFQLDNSFQDELCTFFYNLFQRYITDAYMRVSTEGDQKLDILLEYLEKEFKLSQRVAQKSGRNKQEKPIKKQFTKRMVNQVGKVSKAKAAPNRVAPSAPRDGLTKHSVDPPCTNVRCKSKGHNCVCCIWLSTATKFHLAVELMLCLICLSDEHKTEKCERDPNYTCFNCRGKHHRSICPNLGRSKPPQRSSNQVNQVDRKYESSDSDSGLLTGMFKQECKVKESENDDFVYMVRRLGERRPQSVRIWFGVWQDRIAGLIDTGATINIMPFSVALQIDPGRNIEVLENPLALRAVGQGFDVNQYIEIPVTIGVYTNMLRFYVTNNCDQVLLSVEVFMFFRISISNNLIVKQLLPNGDKIVIDRVTDQDERHQVNFVCREKSVLRAKQQPSVFQNLFSISSVLFFIVMFCFISNCSGQPPVETADPLLWFRTANRAVSAINFTSHIAVLSSPCTQLTQVMKGLKSATEIEAFQQCEKAYEREVLSVIYSNCGFVTEIPIMDRQPVEVHVFRRKRFAGIVAGAITGIVSYGILSLSHIWEKKVESPDVRAVQNQLQVQLDNIHKHNSLVESYQSKVDKNLKTMWHQMMMIDQRVTSVDRENKALMLLLQQISKMGLLLTRVLHSFKLDPPKVDIDYQALFPGNPLEAEVPSFHWIPKKCFYTNTSRVIFHFDIPVLSKRSVILKADAMVLLANSSDNQECSLKFKGNMYVVLDTTTNCTHELLTNPKTEHDLVYVLEDYDKCIENDNRTKQWEVQECHSRTLKTKKYRQLRHDDHYTYIYCVHHQLTIQGRNMFDCENVVYKIPRGTSFSVDGQLWPSQFNTFESSYRVKPEITKLINDRTFKGQITDKSNLNDLGKIVLQESQVNEHIGWKKVVHSPYSYISLSSVIVCVVMILVIVMWRRCQRDARMRHRFRDFTDYLTNRVRGDNVPMNNI